MSSLFSTPRDNKPSGKELLEAAIARKATQKRNMQAISEATKLSKNIPDFTPTLESSNLAVEQQQKQDKLLEQRYYRQGTRMMNKNMLGLRSALMESGRDMLSKQVLAETIYQAYWLDTPVKESSVEEISETITKTLAYLESKCMDSKVSEANLSPYMKNVNAVIEETVKKATDRIMDETKSSGASDAEFELTTDEEDKLDEKLSDLGRDEIVDLIKEKVADVIQDEKQRGQEKAEMFKEIDDAANGNSDDELTDAEESFLTNYESTGVMEATTTKAIKIYFSSYRKKASKTLKEANRLFKLGKYDDAYKCYHETREIMNDLENQVRDLDDNIWSVILSTIVSCVFPLVRIVYAADDFKTMFIGRGNNGAHYDAQTGMDRALKNMTYNQQKAFIMRSLDTTVQYCDIRMKQCKNNGTYENPKTNGGKYKYAVESTDAIFPEDGGMRPVFALTEAVKFSDYGNYTSNEKFLLESIGNGVTPDIDTDPTWSEFKVYVSAMCKKATALVQQGENSDDFNAYGSAITIIDDIMSKLTDIDAENIPADVIRFVNAMITMVYSAVPMDEVLISRFDTNDDVTWNDLLVNAKVNIASVRSYLINKSRNYPDSNTPQIMAGKNSESISSLESVIATKQMQKMNSGIGSSLFEALMIGTIAATERSVSESSLDASVTDVDNAALIESLLYYTIFETVDSLGIYKFRMNDINGIKQDFVRSVSEGENPLEGTDNEPKTSKKSLSMDSGSGAKKIRINTQKMKRNNDDKVMSM